MGYKMLSGGRESYHSVLWKRSGKKEEKQKVNSQTFLVGSQRNKVYKRKMYIPTLIYKESIT